MSKPRTIFVDVDGVLCHTKDAEYSAAKPIHENIAKINELYDEGHYVVIWTARGATTKKNWRPVTQAQLSLWKVKHHELRMDKPFYDEFIDDKARSAP